MPLPCPAAPSRPARHPALAGCALAAAAVLLADAAAAAPSLDTLAPGLGAEVQRLAEQSALTLWGGAGAAPRVEVQIGALDPHLQLAPCARVEPYLPPGHRPLGSLRIGLRCVQGAKAWNVSVPVKLRLWARAPVAGTPLPSGTVIRPEHLTEAEVDLAGATEPVIGWTPALLGRTLVHTLGAGQPLRRSDLKPRQWFAIGETVRLVAAGPGYTISGEAQALGPGIEGQPVKARTEGGRIVTGMASSQGCIEVAL